MILHRLTLNDFGLYGGEHIFDLTPNLDEGRPVILVRGHNGAGKTTFLEAIRLALYGKRALGMRVARASYEDYLSRRIYEWSCGGRACVKLAFRRQEQGIMHLYEVTRSWASRGASVIEAIELTCDGEVVSDIAAEEWDHYLEDMIPAGVSQLFFFDGEKIQDIADGGSTLALREAIKALLGLDLINQLRSDLVVYNSRRDPAKSGVDIEAIERDLNEAKSELVLIEEDAAECRAERHRAQSCIARAQKVFSDEGGIAAIDLAGLKQTLREVEKRIELLHGELKRIAETALPLGLAPNLIAKFQQCLTRLRSQSRQRTIRDFLESFANDEKTKKSKQPLWTNDHFSALQAHSESACGDDDLLKLDAEPDWIIERLNTIDSDARAAAALLGTELDDAYRERSHLKSQIKGFDVATAKDALEALKTAEYQLGAVDTRLSEKERMIASLRHRIESLMSERDRAINIDLDIQRAHHKVDLAQRTRAALAVYEKRVLERRVEKLSSHFVECFNGLSHKKRLFSKVQVDPETFEFSLIGEDGREFSKDALSAGERQIFAISMLWALGKTSGQELPMIIDTPLSRLDKAHRKAMIADYVPHASQQVILLCTDTELTEELDNLVAPFVARRYEIGVESGSRGTQVAEKTVEPVYAH